MSLSHIEDIYELSPLQQGMLFHSLLAPESGIYFIQRRFTLQGTLNVAALKEAWRQVMARHSILRTAFVWEDLEKPLQLVYQDVTVPFVYQDWRTIPQDEQEVQLRAFWQEEQVKGFDPSQPPLIRLTLFQLSDETYKFVFAHHHALLDGWSLPLLLGEAGHIYQAIQSGQSVHLPASPPYSDYIAWLQAQDSSAAEQFWREQLQGFTAPTPLMAERIVPAKGEHDSHYADVVIRISRAETAMLRAFTRSHKITLNTLIQGIWALLLSRYSGERDVVFGTTVSSRPAELAGVEKMIGLFINTVPVRVIVDNKLTLPTWLGQLQAQQVESRHYSYTPLVQIQEWSDVPRKQALFNTLLVFDSLPTYDTAFHWSSAIEVNQMQEEGARRTNYPLTLCLTEEKEHLTLSFGYDASRFEAATITRMAGHFQTLLHSSTTHAHIPISRLPMLTAAEKQRITLDWNAASTPPLPAANICELFQAQVERTPNAVALLFEGHRWTYAKLNRRANQLAHHLRDRLGVKPETLIGLCLQRSPEMVLALLATLKAGGAYLPLDPAYPAERLAYMLTDSGTQVVLTQQDLLPKLTDLSETLTLADHLAYICLDEDKAAWQTAPITNPVTLNHIDNLAYIIYTSGSTGNPKGVAIPHRGTIALLHWANDLLTPEDKAGVLAATSISFDCSTFELFVPLSSGGTIILVQDALHLPELKEASQVTLINTVPSAMSELIQMYDALPQARVAILGGEALSPQIAEILYRDYQIQRVINGYGPTEDTTFSTYHVIEPGVTTPPPIGRPLPGTAAYILDQEGEPTPVGVPGELCLAGVGLTRGYLHRPALTAEKFVPNPFGRNQGDRLYRTGDLAYFRADGTIEFIGRIDHQVKLRGFRIELGEIEALMEQNPAVKTAVVLVQEDESCEPAQANARKQLIAYVSAPRPTPQLEEELYNALKEKLPAYMVPGAIVSLPEFPRLPNGKIDRRTLATFQPDSLPLANGRAALAPRTPVEEIVAQIWADVLNVSQPHIEASFFELGGHSLLATQVMTRLNRAFQTALPLRTLFENGTIEDLAQQVEMARRIQQGHLPPPITPIAHDTDLPLSFAQQRLWLINQLQPKNHAYNCTEAVFLQGAINIQALEQSLSEIVRRHATLRTTFHQVEGRPVQRISPPTPFTVKVVDLSELPSGQKRQISQRLGTEEAQLPFDLSHGPLLRITLLRLTNTEHAILFNIHHIISDAWSVGIFMRELVTLYRAFLAQKPSPLPELPIQYADFAHWQREWLQGKTKERILAYWKKQLADPPLLKLPTDHPRPDVQTFRGAREFSMIPQALVDDLYALSRDEQSSLFMVLLAAFYTLLHRYTGQDDIVIGSPIANRNRPEIESLIGFFVNTLVLRLNLAGNPTFRQVIHQVRQVALDAYTYQDLPFEQLVEELQPERDLSRSPLFQVMLILQNTPTAPDGLELPEMAVRPLNFLTGTAMFDLLLNIAETGQGAAVWLEYNIDLFEADTIVELLAHWYILLEAVTADPTQSILDIKLDEDGRMASKPPTLPLSDRFAFDYD